MLKLSVRDLSLSIGRKRIFSGVAFEAEGPAMISVIGRNGAGKSSLMKSLIGLLPASGSVTLTEDGETLGRRSIAYLPQMEEETSRLSVFEMVLLGLTQSLSWRVTQAQYSMVTRTLESLRLGTLSDRPMWSLSGGQRQLVYLAQVLVVRPRLLMLDEPTSALDMRHQLVVMQAVENYVKETGAIALFVIHDLALAARFSRRAFLVHGGKIEADGAPENIFRSETLDPIYRVTTLIEPNSGGHLTVTPLEPKNDLPR